MALSVEHFGEESAAPVVVGTSTINGIATTPYQTWAFRRAEITAFVGSPFRLPSGNALAFGRVRQLNPRLFGADRLVALAVEALEPLASLIGRIASRAPLAIGLCLPERADGRPNRPGDAKRIRRALESRIAGPLFERGASVDVLTVPKAHASFGYAALEIGRKLVEGRVGAALFIGVDSYYDPFVLEQLFREERVLDSDWREGFVPGEAASALLLARPALARELGLEALARLDGVATNEEIATRDNTAGLLGQGLSRPAVALVERLKEQGRTLDWWISDATGEPLRTQELQLAWPRAAHLAMTPEGVIDLLPTHFGDIGAATMPTAAVLGIEGLRRGDPVGRTVVITGSSDDGSRAVALFTARVPEG